MLIGLFIAFIMIASIFGVVLDYYAAPATKLKYNNFKFQRVNEQYVTTINGKQHTFSFFPRDLEAIQVPDGVRTLLQQPVVTVTYDPKSDMAENLGEAQYYFEVQLQDITIERALTDNTNTTLPKKSCSDATPEQLVVELRQSNESRITVDKNCLVVNALDPFDLYQETERIIYSGLGVMT